MTGIRKIDTDFGFPCGYYVILGNPGSGKSWFSLWLSRMFNRHHQLKSVYFSLEMPEPVVRSRILQQWSDLTKFQYETDGDKTPALEKLEDDSISVNDFYTDDQKQQTIKNFEEWIDKYYEIGFRIFHFDHLHELAGANANESNQKVTESWAKCFQKISKKYDDVWMFIYAQPNGAAASKKILRRTDIAGSKAITQKCDYVLSLNKNFKINEDTGLPESDEETRNIVLYLDKTRYTENVHMGFKLYFDYTGNFYEITNRT